MKVVMVKPMEKAEIAEIEPTLDEYQRIVNGYIECVYPFPEEVVLVCNEEGKYSEEPNRALYDSNGEPYDIVYGTFFICGAGYEDFESLTDEQAERYRKQFEQAEGFLQTKNGIAIMRF